jgi:hypothetical protein
MNQTLMTLVFAEGVLDFKILGISTCCIYELQRAYFILFLPVGGRP